MFVLFMQGLYVTLKLLTLSLIAGLPLALVIALMRSSARIWLNWPAFLYNYIIRGTPVLIQLYAIYYGCAQLSSIVDSWLWMYFSSPTFCAWLAFTINTSAYSSEILLGSIKLVNAGEIEAAKAYGMSTLTRYRRVILPAALRQALPAYSNEVIAMLHTTSLASVVTLLDITGTARSIYGETFEPFAPFLIAAGLYLGLTFILIQIFHVTEKRWLVHLNPRL